MNLHKSSEAFRDLIIQVSIEKDIEPAILEKDYYVTLLLKEISEIQKTSHVYFKGGTALYKALRSIRRFSEDIDLTVDTEDCSSKNQKRTRLKKAAQGYQSLGRLIDDPENDDRKGSVTCIYGYDLLVDIAEDDDPLQRYGHVKVEATSFTISEPVEPLKISPIIYFKSSEATQKILREKYQTGPFFILTAKLGRIFIDKVFAAEFYFQKFKNAVSNEEKENFGFDVAKHIYDLIVLYNEDSIRRLMNNQSEFSQLIMLKRKEEASRMGSHLNELRINEFSYLYEAIHSDSLNKIFSKMQDIYVFKDTDKALLSDSRLVFDAIIKLDLESDTACSSED